jgi:hypothetical protein
MERDGCGAGANPSPAGCWRLAVLALPVKLRRVFLFLFLFRLHRTARARAWRLGWAVIRSSTSRPLYFDLAPDLSLDYHHSPIYPFLIVDVWCYTAE